VWRFAAIREHQGFRPGARLALSDAKHGRRPPELGKRRAQR
jgi:hypothetical protein